MWVSILTTNAWYVTRICPFWNTFRLMAKILIYISKFKVRVAIYLCLISKYVVGDGVNICISALSKDSLKKC